MPSWKNGEPLEKIILQIWSHSPAQLAQLPCLPHRSLSPERENSVLLSGFHRVQDKSLCREKNKEIACASFADSFCRHLTSIAHLCPACSCCWKFFAIPLSVLEEVVSLLFGDCGHRQQLEKQVTEPHKQHKTGQIQPITSQPPSSYPVPAVRDWPTYTLASSS